MNYYIENFVTVRMKFLDRNINPAAENENNMLASLDTYKYNKDTSKKKDYKDNDNNNRRKNNDYGFKLRARNKNLNLNEKVKNLLKLYI